MQIIYDGKRKNRSALEELLKCAHKGDVVIVGSFASIADSAKDLFDIVAALREKGVEFVSDQEQFDTATQRGEYVLTIFEALARLEQSKASSKQTEGKAAAKAARKHLGRKPIVVDEALFAEQYKLWKSGETAPKFMRKKLGLSHATFYRKVKEYERVHGIAPNEE